MKLATLTSSLFATAFFAIGGAALPSVALASPDDGVVCRSGYAGALNSTRFVCSKTRIISIGLECLDRRFPTKVVRAPGAAGDSSGGRDICTRPGIVIGTTDPLTGLVQGQDFVFAVVNGTTVSNQIGQADQQEATALGLNVAEVDTAGSTPTVAVNGGFGSNDVARVTLTFNTFAIPALSLIQPIPLPVLPSLPSPRLP